MAARSKSTLRSSMSGELTLGSIRDGIMALPTTAEEGPYESVADASEEVMDPFEDTERSSLSGIEIQVPVPQEDEERPQMGGRRALSNSGKTIPPEMLDQILEARLDIAASLNLESAIKKKEGAGNNKKAAAAGVGVPVMPEGKKEEAGTPVLSTNTTTPVGVSQAPGAFACRPTVSFGDLEVGTNSQVAAVDGSATEDAATDSAGAPENHAARPGATHVSSSLRLPMPEPQTSGSNSDLYSSMNTGFFTTATAVEESEVEDEIRRRIISEAVEADVVDPSEQQQQQQQRVPEEDEEQKVRSRRFMLCTVGSLLVIVLAVATALIVVLVDKDNGDEMEKGDGQETTSLPSEVPNEFLTMSTIELVRNRGVVNCGVSGTVPGFSYPNPETGELEGLNVDHCRAIALAVFGDPGKLDLIWVLAKDRFPMLLNGTIDIMAITTTHTMSRDVFEASAQHGFTFTVPFFYTGLTFSGLPEYVECADNMDSLYGHCRSMKACVIKATTHEDQLQELLPGVHVVLANSTSQMVENFINGECHIICSEKPNTPEVRFRDAGYTGDFVHSQQMFSQEPLSIVTRKEDPEWSNLVGFIVNLFYLAEAHGISKSNSDAAFSLLEGHADETNEKDMKMVALMEAIISEFGHFGDLYEKNLQHIVPRLGANTLYLKDAIEAQFGLLYSFPFGNIDTKGIGPVPDLTLDRILRRGRLRCGILDTSLENTAFAKEESNGTWTGFDVELCRAIGAALFLGDTNAVHFERLRSRNATSALDGEEVDVISGARVTLQADYQGYAFSLPYYYDDEKMDARAFMTLDADTQWSDFVYWIVMALVHAEENGIGSDTALGMPVVQLFGEGLKQMLGDCVIGVGSYGDVYNRTLAATIPRSGGNLLNRPTFGPQQFPIPFV